MSVDVKIRKEILWSGENPIMLLKETSESKETTAVGFLELIIHLQEVGMQFL